VYPPPDIGEIVSYFPQQNEGENIHFEVKVIGHTKAGRVRIEGASAAGSFRRTVSPSRLLRQGLIAA
jgi:hypothetical protein